LFACFHWEQISNTKPQIIVLEVNYQSGP
jgi:hypothetical protein